jgi:DNA (cytosine-5)-methyltransferase 1
MPSVLSLFTGAGGIDLGLEAAGFELVGAVECDAAARKTLARNRPNWSFTSDSDVFKFVQSARPSHFGLKPGELDLLAGGPPCQPFSKAAQWRGEGRRGTSDARAECIDAMVAVAELFRPKLIREPDFASKPARARIGRSLRIVPIVLPQLAKLRRMAAC